MAKSPQPPLSRERAQFRSLLLANPNHFGNLPGAPTKAAVKLVADSSYESIGCVGYQPQFRRLDAVIFIKQASGYLGGPCSAGSPEYVRFYLSFDGGSSWQDQGLTSFTAYDISGTSAAGRLEYAVGIEIDPPQQLCTRPNLLKARAILSWNQPPPSESPDWKPVWGDIHDTWIQVEPLRLLPLRDLFAELDLEPPPSLVAVLPLDQVLKAEQVAAPGVADLAKAYGKKVEPARFLGPTLKKLAAKPTVLAKLDLDPKLIQAVLDDDGDGDTRYERLECVGLDARRDNLVGVVRVRLPQGYSGSLCTEGSTEYVTFWADFDGDGHFESNLGTTSVRVHDIAELPDGGLEYAVFLPVNFDSYRRPCEAGARLVKIRAILSWQTPPSSTDPDWKPRWGNREETTVHLRPGSVDDAGTHYPYIETIGGMARSDLDADGLATGAAVTAGFHAEDSPFGGEIVLTGHIGNATDLSAGAGALRYRVQISEDLSNWTDLTNAIVQRRSQLLDGLWSDLPDVTVNVEAGNWYRYLEDLSGGAGNAMIFVKGNVLARWPAHALSGKWWVRVQVSPNPTDLSPTIYQSAPIAVRIDNTAPTASISITSGGGDCGDFVAGSIIEGQFSASDEHFSHLTIGVSPGLGGSFTAPSPMPAYPVASTSGASGTWRLDTTGMPRCGYVVVIQAWDRTIYNSGAVGLQGSDVVGLCLRT